jgi:hypothetical protein
MGGSQVGDEDMLMEKLEQESFDSQNEAFHSGSLHNENHCKDFKGKPSKLSSGSYNMRNRRYRKRVEELDIKINQEITTKSLKKEIKEKLLTNKLDKRIREKEKFKLEGSDRSLMRDSSFDEKKKITDSSEA